MPTRNLSTIRIVAYAALFAVAYHGSGYVAAEEVDFAGKVKPLLARRCFACHGPDVSESSLALHQRDAALAEPDSGDFAIVPGDPDSSELMVRITSHEGDRMPPEGEPLTDDEVKILRDWIAAGAKYTKHWAFVPPQQQTPPAVDSDWARNPVDAFLFKKLQAAGLKPNPPADKRTLVRRLYFDLTGLPPTLEELNAFVSDTRPDAYERLVDRLLASPRYGEKWARHWLDVVRYAESNSFERDAAKPFAWKYRDYVIRSFNNDKPYDQFIREQIAGDELDEVTDDSIIATGYYRLGTWDDEPADPLQSKYDDLDNILSTTSQGILGLTVGCARCHDHKIDPIPQTDYYSLLSFFADVTPYALPHQRDPELHSLWDLSPPKVAAHRRELKQAVARGNESSVAIEQAAIQRMEGPDQRKSETHDRQELLDEKLEQYATPEEFAEYRRLKRQVAIAKQQLRKMPKANYALSLAKSTPHPEQMYVMLRGSAHAQGEAVDPRFPELFGDGVPSIPQPPADARSSGRRRVLADWLTDPDNLLTSRVIANRVWQHHFGRGIVRSSNNFGQLGTPPTHPELLDWLANWLVEHEWRLKPLHRLILTSNAYQMSSTATPEGLAIDPANHLFWRFDMRRLSAEELRDTVLQVSGQLNDKMYGPSIYPPLSEEVLATQSMPGKGWHTSSPREAARRSIYIHIKRSLIPPSLANFDFPDTDTSCEARFNTTQAAQALNLMHGDFMQNQAKHFSQRVWQETAELDENEAAQHVDRARVRQALQLALKREPDEATIDDGLALLDLYQSKHNLSKPEALRQLCLMVLNLNEFVYLD